jgi:deoxyribodipyrimidine photo-lyase
MDDNPALARAVRSSTNGTLAVFFCCPQQWRAHDWGPPKVDFVLRSLRSLSADLEKAGIALLVETVPTFDAAPGALLDIAQRHECDRLLFNLEYEVNERHRDRRVRELFATHSIDVETFEDQTVVPPGSLLTGKGTFYTVFSPFRRAWIGHLDRAGLPEPSPASSSGAELICPPGVVPDRIEGFETFSAADQWPAGETAAAKALDEFIEERIENYDRTRDLPALNGTSTLSPHLAAGTLSIRRCLTAAVAANRGRLDGGGKGIDVWISELVWREFYRHVLVGYPRVSKHRPFKESTASIGWRSDDDELEAWKEGRTGVPFVDAGMRQLLATGWMHNRVRMVTAMFLTKDLLIDWRLGEAHFMSHLVDADLANNNGGWQWSASTGTDAAPYFRIFNPWTQGKKFDPGGEYIQRWIPELRDVSAQSLHQPGGLSDEQRSSLGYPQPIVDHKSARIRALEAFAEEAGAS